MNSTFGQRLKIEMVLHGLQGRELAKLVGVHPTQISKWIHDDIKPSVEKLCAILQALPSTDARKLIVGPQ